MKLWEAMQAVEEGKKVCHSDSLVTSDGIDSVERLIEVAHYGKLHDGWELYDGREEPDQVTKDLYTLVKRVSENWCTYDDYLDNDSVEDAIGDTVDYVSKLYLQLSEMNKYYKLDK